jgi:uncharacterized membrane protein YuzA (DUF378 family)
LSAGVEVDGWHIIKWVWAAVFLVYLTVQVFAVRRLKGNRKGRSNLIAIIMVLLMGLSDAIQQIFFFENRAVSRIGSLVVGVAAIIATIVLVSMFGEGSVADSERQGDADQRVQSLNLS